MTDSEKDLLIQWRNNYNGRASVQYSNDGEDYPDISLPSRGTASTAAAIFIVVNAAMGAGLLNFPHAFSNAGGIGSAIAMEMVSNEVKIFSLGYKAREADAPDA